MTKPHSEDTLRCENTQLLLRRSFISRYPQIYIIASIPNEHHLGLQVMVTTGFKWVKLIKSIEFSTCRTNRFYFHMFTIGRTILI